MNLHDSPPENCKMYKNETSRSSDLNSYIYSDISTVRLKTHIFKICEHTIQTLFSDFSFMILRNVLQQTIVFSWLYIPSLIPDPINNDI